MAQVSAANLCGVLLAWPAFGPPLAFFESDGLSFKVTNLAWTEAEADAADQAIADAIAWGEWPVEAPPPGWRIALEGELVPAPDGR